jgi:hypothetical protein
MVTSTSTLIDKDGKIVKKADSLSKLLENYEVKFGDHVVLYECNKRDYITFFPHLEGVMLLKDDEKIFLNREFIFQKNGTSQEVWRGIIAHPEGIMTIIDGEPEKKLILFKKDNQSEVIFAFQGKYETEDHPGLLGVLIKNDNTLFHNNQPIRIIEKEESLYPIKCNLKKDLNIPNSSCFDGMLWIETAYGVKIDLCRHNLNHEYLPYLNKGFIVEKNDRIVLFLIEKGTYKS